MKIGKEREFPFWWLGLTAGKEAIIQFAMGCLPPLIGPIVVELGHHLSNDLEQLLV